MSILTKKAVVAKVPIGQILIDGLMLPDGQFGVAVSQIFDLFGGDEGLDISDKKYTTRYLQRLCGEGFKSDKIKSELAKNQVNFVSLEIFELVVAKLDRAGNKKAQDFRDDLVGLSLKQIFSDAFGQKFEEEERQIFLTERQTHREKFHPLLTSWWQKDGLNHGEEYAIRVNEFKRASKLPLKPVESYDYPDLSLLNRMEGIYDILRKTGKTHREAIELISQ